MNNYHYHYNFTIIAISDVHFKFVLLIYWQVTTACFLLEMYKIIAVTPVLYL